MKNRFIPALIAELFLILIVLVFKFLFRGFDEEEGRYMFNLLAPIAVFYMFGAFICLKERILVSDVGTISVMYQLSVLFIFTKAINPEFLGFIEMYFFVILLRAFPIFLLLFPDKRRVCGMN